MIGLGHAEGTWEAVQKLLPKGRKKVLDLGCGNFIWLNPHYEIHRCDWDRNIVTWWNKYQMEKGISLNFKCCDLNKNFPYKDDEFDGAVAIELIEHLENPRHFLRECKRIAKEFIVFTTPNCLCKKSRQMFKDLGRFWWFEDNDYYQSGHITPLFLWQIQQIIEELEMRIEEIEYSNPETEEIMIIKLKTRISKHLND